MSHRNTQDDEHFGFNSSDISKIKKEVAAEQLKLGISYFKAYHIEDNCSIAFNWIKLSAKQDNMEAQFRLAELYSLGQGTSRSHTDAYKWYTKAAIQGYKKALIRIHNLYQQDIEIHCRGKLNSGEQLREKPKRSRFEETENYYRELYEQRLDDNKLVLNHAIDYYNTQFEKYKSSNKEDPEAQQILGFLYQNGYGVKKYHKWAIEYYTKAAEQGYVDSQYQLGVLYQKNTDIKFNYRKAFYWYKLAAEGGNTAAQNCLAYLYEKGLGTDIDYENALFWYTKSAESGHSRAQLTLGKWYRKGDHVNRNYGTAIKWYTLAVQQGNSIAQNCLDQLFQAEKLSNLSIEVDVSKYCKDESKEGRLHSKLQMDILEITDHVLSRKIRPLAKHALIGDGNAMYQIGLKYYHGTDFTKNKHIGFRWLKNAADAGFQEAITKVAKMYEDGDTVEQNYRKTAIWTMKNVGKKSSKALCDLGILYNEGRGVRNDPLEASKWFTLSAYQGNSEAQYQLGSLRREGRGLRKDEKEALELFQLSAKQGNANGCYGLGLLLFRKDAFRLENNSFYTFGYEDNETGLKLLEYSAKYGCEDAQYELWKFYDNKDESKANFYFDMLLFSNDTYLIQSILDDGKHFRVTGVNHTRYFKLLEKAASLDISDAKEMFQTPLRIAKVTDAIDVLYRTHLTSTFIFVSDNGIFSMEYQLGYLYEYSHKDLTDAIYWYRRSAEKGDSRAQVQLGVMHEEGKGVVIDFTEAIKYYTLACEKANTDAMYRLACMLLDGRGVSQDLKKAFDLFNQASDAGHIEARKVLTLSYNALDEDSSEYIHYQRVITEVNGDNRIKMLETMAESGLVAIQYQLGILYDNKDDSKAFNWYTLAARGGITEAYYRLGVLYEEGRGTKKDYSNSINYFEMAAKIEHKDAMYRLAHIYFYGKGTGVNYSKAYQLYYRAAMMGHALSSRVLGLDSVAENNRDVTHTSEDKFKFSIDPSSNEFERILLMFEHVAKEGDAQLQYKLGVIYECTLTTPNYEEAVNWYSMAIKNHHSGAMYRLGKLYEVGLGVAQNYQKAIDLYKQAHNLGNYDALYQLGGVYHYDVVTTADQDRAVQYYTEAANNGHSMSQYILGRLYEVGELVKQDYLKAVRWYTKAYLGGYDHARIELYDIYDDISYESFFHKKLNALLISTFKGQLFSDSKSFYDADLDPSFNPGNKLNVTEQVKLGISYFNEYLIEDNCLTAFKSITLSAEQGNTEAQFRLAELYSLGLGTSVSLPDAYKWYTKAAIRGYKKASIRLHNLYQEDIKMHCRGRLNSDEKHRQKPKKDNDDKYEKAEYYYRELYEQRSDDYKLTLNYAVKYYATQFKKYKASDQEDPEILENLGFLYQHGYGVKKYDKWAIEYYTKAAEQGYVDSQYQLGVLYQKNTDIKFNYRKAFYWYKLAAEGGNTAAQNCLAYLYEKGLGTDIDYENALFWYTKSAESGHSRAQLTLGKWYRKGEYVDQSYTTAVKWYILAAQQGNSAALSCLAQLYQAGHLHMTSRQEEISKYLAEHSRSQILSFNLQMDILKINDPSFYKKMTVLAKRALVGDRSAMYEIGLKYYYGIDLIKNKQIAFKWIKNAADASLEEAMLKIAEMYEDGDIVSQDFHKVAIWTKRLAKQKNDKALCDLGILYNEGKGVRRDPLEASKWFTLSADRGNSEAQYQLGRLRREGRGLRKDEKEALELFQLSAKQGNIGGCYEVAEKYYNGNQLIDNETKSYKMLVYSAEKGNSYAQYKLWNLHRLNGDDSKADSYFDMLIDSSNATLIREMCNYFISKCDDGSNYTEFTEYIDYVKHFNLFKKAADLGITTAKKIFQTPIDLKYEKYRNKLLVMFIQAYNDVVASTEYQIGYIYENNSSDRVNFLRDYTSAFFWYNVLELKEDSRAQVRLGIMHEEGKGTDPTLILAFNYYNLAYEKGNTDAMYRLACMYLDGRGVSQNFEKAFELYTQASDMGHIEARKVLLLPHNSLNKHSSEYRRYQQLAVEINNDNRIKMLESIAESGVIAIQHQLGIFYENKDVSKAIKWLTFPAKSGVTDACYRLAVLYEEGKGIDRNFLEAISFYETAAMNEHEDAMYRLAQIYMYGKGTEINYKKAYHWHSRAASIGHHLSCKVLALNYIVDDDSTAMYPRSVKTKFSSELSSSEFIYSLLMFQYIAQEGDTEVQFKLGVYYENRLDTPDYKEATKWYSLAVENTHKEATYRLGLLYEKGLGVTLDYQRAIYLYDQAYSLGNYDALYRLGGVYHYGVVAAIDPKRAIQCYTEAANNGHIKSQCTLGNIYEEGTMVKRNVLKALEWYTKAYLSGYDLAGTKLYSISIGLLYENYFIKKLSNILISVSESLLFSDSEEYNEIYGSILYRLGIHYLRGIGITPDYSKAWDCFEISEYQFNFSTAKNVLYQDHIDDKDLFRKFIEMYEILFDKLNPRQQYNLAMLYYNGVYIIPTEKSAKLEEITTRNISTNLNSTINNQYIVLARDYVKSASFLKRIAGDRYHIAQLQLASMYAQGQGVEKSAKIAINCYTKASDNSVNTYTFEIAQMYLFDNDFRDYSKAIEWYKRVRGYKKGISLNILGTIYKNGSGVNQDYKQALRYFTESADRNDRYGCYNLALMYYYGQGVEKDYQKAYKYFKMVLEIHQRYLEYTNLNEYDLESNMKSAKNRQSNASNHGSEKQKTNITFGVTSCFSTYPEEIEWHEGIDQNASFISHDNVQTFDHQQKFLSIIDKNDSDSPSVLEKMYSENGSLQEDRLQAYVYFMKATEVENIYAQQELKEMYLDGHSVDKNIEIAIEWYSRGSQNETNCFSFNIARFYERDKDLCDYKKAIEWYKKVEGNNKASALNNIGAIYYNAKNYEQAIRYYMESAGLGNLHASYALGKMYHSGKVVNQDYNEAFYFFDTAANRDHVGAQEKLGKMYLHGHGVSHNINQAIEWYTRASDNGSDNAVLVLGQLYHFSIEIQDFLKSFEWYQKVQGSDISYALRGIGLLFEYGDGVDQNNEKAVKYYKESTSRGNSAGYYNLALMYYHGKGVDQDYKKCFDLLNKSVQKKGIRPIQKEPNSDNTHVLIRTEGYSNINNPRQKRIYSLESEATLYEEIYFQLGIMYKNGQGTDQNIEKAKECFLKSIEYESERVKKKLNNA